MKHAKLVLLISLVFGFSILSAPLVRAEEKPEICIYFFHLTGCHSCDEASDYLKGLEDKYHDVVIRKFDITGGNNTGLLNKLHDTYNVPESRRGVPVVFISDQYFVGNEITTFLEDKIISLEQTGCECPSIEDGSPLNPSGLICIYFFYKGSCTSCIEKLHYIEGLEKNYTNVVIHKFDTRESNNSELLSKLWDAYKVSEEDRRSASIVFISDQYFVGNEITTFLEDKIISLEQTGCECPSYKEGPLNPSSLSFLVITGAALVDSINPCAIAILLFLLGSLTLVKQAKKVYRTSLAYIISVFITYFLVGLGLFTFLHVSGISHIFYLFIGILAIVIGALNLKDFLWPGGGGFAMEIPQKWRPSVEKLVVKITSPVGALLMGFVIALFELPCTGGPYIFILGLLAETATRPLAVLMLLYYNFIFVLPLIIITILFYFGHSRGVKRVFGTQRKDVKRLLHLLSGILMIILGVVVFLRLV